MRTTTWCVCTLMAVALAMTGCKKDGAPAAPAGAQGAKTTAADPAKADPTKADPAKAPEADPAKAPEADPAKADPTEAPEADSAKAPEGEPTKAPDTATAVVTIPDNVIAYGGIKSLDDLSARVTSVANEIKPTPGLDAVMSGAIAKGLGLSSLDWLDTSKPIVFAVSNPKESDAPFALVLPMKSKEAFEKALPEAHEAGVDGAAFKYKQGASDTFVSYAGDRVVIAEDAKAAQQLRGFIEGGLAAYAPQSTLEVTVSIANSNRIYAAEVAAARASMTERTALAKHLEGDPAGSPLNDAIGALGDDLQWFFDLVPQIDAATFALRLDGDHVMLPLTITAKKDTALDTLLDTARGPSLTLLDYVPATSYLVLGANVDPAKLAKWTDLGFSLLAAKMKLTDEDTATMRALLQKTSALQTGETVVAFHKDGPAALSMLVLGGTTDGAKLREASVELYGMLWTKGIEYMKATEGGPKKDLDLSTFPKAIEALSVMAAPLGVTLALTSEAKGEGTIDALSIGIDYAKLPVTTDNPKEAAVMKAVFGERIVIAVGHGKERRAIAVGADATARVTEVLEGKKTAPSPALKMALAHAVPGSSLLLYVSVIEGLKAWSALPDLAPLASRIAAMSAPNGAAISVGSVSGGGLQTVIDIPVSHVKQLMTLQ